MVSNVKFRGKARSLVGQRVNFRPNRFATLKIQIKIGVNGLTAVAVPQFSRGPTNLTLHTAMCCVVCILYSRNRRTPAIRPPTDCLPDWLACHRSHSLPLRLMLVYCCGCLLPMHTSGNRRDTRTIERQPKNISNNNNTHNARYVHEICFTFTYIYGPSAQRADDGDIIHECDWWLCVVSAALEGPVYRLRFLIHLN